MSLILGDTVPAPHTNDHLLSILSEALVNINRHAQATQVWVKLEAKNKYIELEIKDDGQGFDPEVETGEGHYGLLGMQERAQLVGGILEIETGTGQGTRIRLIVPIYQEA
jgi:NarL family two-component system sensor histidine kinase YdfH